MINYYIEEIIPKEKLFSPETVFKDYALYWLESAKCYLAPKTYQRYSDLLDIINKALGHIHMKNIASYHLKLFYQKLSSDGANRNTGGKLSAKTILHYHRLISVILHQATIDGVIELNVASKDYIKIPKVESYEARFLEESEINSVLKVLINEPIKWRTALEVLLFTGLRRGELLGLEWQDIDFENNLIHIERTSQYIPRLNNEPCKCQ